MDSAKSVQAIDAETLEKNEMPDNTMDKTAKKEYSMLMTPELMEAFNDRRNVMDWYYEHQNDADGMFPDTFGCESIFLEDLLYDAGEDLAPAVHDYLLHRPEALTQTERECYICEEPGYLTLTDSVRARILNIMYTDAVSGNDYAAALFRYLYQLLFRKEYQQLKRFRTLSAMEAIALAKSDESLDSLDIYCLARILAMAPLFGIEVQPDCAFCYNVLNKTHRRRLESHEEETAFPENIPALYKECREKVSEWMASVRLPYSRAKELKVYRETAGAFELMLADDCFPKDYLSLSRNCSVEIRTDLVHVLYIMKSRWPKKEFSFEEVQRWAAMYECEQALTDIVLDTGDFLDECLRAPASEEEKIPGSFDPSKILIPKTGRKNAGAEERKPAAKASVSAGEDAAAREAVLLTELQSLRKKLRQQKLDMDAAYDQIRQAKQKLEEAEAEIRKYEEERDELIALREHVYHSTEDDIGEAGEEIGEMEQAVAEKKIVIIGGHDNWTYKLKNRFRKWVFFSPQVSGTMNERILDHADRVFFFTDFISHSTYGKFLKVVRDHNIPYGYIHTINIERNIKQVYEETMRGE